MIAQAEYRELVMLIRKGRYQFYFFFSLNFSFSLMSLITVSCNARMEAEASGLLNEGGARYNSILDKHLKQVEEKCSIFWTDIIQKT